MRTFIFGCGAATLVACGGQTDHKVGLEGPTVGATTAEYPSGDFGYEVGKVLPNSAFLGYEHIDPSTTIDTSADEIGAVRFSDYYDPHGDRGLRYLVVNVQTVWCWVSQQEEDATSGINEGGPSYALHYDANGIRFMTLLIDGPVIGADATVSDLVSWVDHHHARTSQALITHAELSLVLEGYAWPYTMVVDLRTMRVMETWIGSDGYQAKIDALTE